MLNRARLVAFSLALIGSTVSAQSVDPRLSSRISDARTRTAVAAIVDSARSVRLPTEPLIDKALEGVAKKASGPQIVAAVRAFMGQMDKAREALGPSTESELVGGAHAIRAGIPVQQLERLRKVRPNVQIAAALTVVSDLVWREVPIDTAVRVVGSLVQASATDDQLLNVRSEIETAILGGMAPALAATSRGQALETTIAASGPPSGAGKDGAIPSPSGTNRTGDGASTFRPPTAVGNVAKPDAPAKPPTAQRRRP